MLNASLLRRPTRRNAPSCRGGASSLLRLAQTGGRSGGGVSGWVQRAAAVLAPSMPSESLPGSIITRLPSSRELAAQS